ncbi:MAG: DUF359 domain-containing protein [Candidatus Thermoplasmatota archaeon]|nr:DUF359 domain-containing protein [Candidatus Thermoplasmatota archaeon]
MHSEFKYVLPESMKDELRIPLGRIVEDFEPFFESNIKNFDGKIITVGDIITEYFINNEKLPWMSIVDGKTKREVINNGISLHKTPVYVKNPPGTITYELWGAIDRACKNSEDTVIFVDGEEDLAAIPAIFLSPPGTLVLYGMPEKGVVIVKTDEAKEKVKRLLKKMEVKYGNKDR